MLDQQNAGVSSLNTYRVIIVTLACSDRLNQIPNIWEDLKDSIDNEVNRLKYHSDVNDFAICFNIHNEGKKVRTSKNDKAKEESWRNWIKEFDYDLVDDCLLM